jgi:hypothetical protein
VDVLQEIDETLKALKTSALQNYQCIICSFAQSGKVSGMVLLERLKKAFPHIPVVSTLDTIIMTNLESVDI